MIRIILIKPIVRKVSATCACSNPKDGIDLNKQRGTLTKLTVYTLFHSCIMFSNSYDDALFLFLYTHQPETVSYNCFMPREACRLNIPTASST